MLEEKHHLQPETTTSLKKARGTPGIVKYDDKILLRHSFGLFK